MPLAIGSIYPQIGSAAPGRATLLGWLYLRMGFALSCSPICAGGRPGQSGSHRRQHRRRGSCLADRRFRAGSAAATAGSTCDRRARRGRDQPVRHRRAVRGTALCGQRRLRRQPRRGDLCRSEAGRAGDRAGGCPAQSGARGARTRLSVAGRRRDALPGSGATFSARAHRACGSAALSRALLGGSLRVETWPKSPPRIWSRASAGRYRGPARLRAAGTAAALGAADAETIAAVESRYVEPPLGWSLSQEVREGMDNTVQNEQGSFDRQFR